MKKFGYCLIVLGVLFMILSGVYTILLNIGLIDANVNNLIVYYYDKDTGKVIALGLLLLVTGFLLYHD